MYYLQIASNSGHRSRLFLSSSKASAKIRHPFAELFDKYNPGLIKVLLEMVIPIIPFRLTTKEQPSRANYNSSHSRTSFKCCPAADGEWIDRYASACAGWP